MDKTKKKRGGQVGRQAGRQTDRQARVRRITAHLPIPILIKPWSASPPHIPCTAVPCLDLERLQEAVTERRTNDAPCSTPTISTDTNINNLRAKELFGFILSPAERSTPSHIKSLPGTARTSLPPWHAHDASIGGGGKTSPRPANHLAADPKPPSFFFVFFRVTTFVGPLERKLPSPSQ